MQLETFLEHSAERFPDKTALVFKSQRLTYREIEEQCNRLANGLLAEGLQKGDRVAVYLDNSVEAVIALFAILKAGAVIMMINPTTKAEKLNFILNHSRASTFITHARKLAAMEGCLNQTPGLQRIIVVGSKKNISGNGAKQSISLDDLLSLSRPSEPPPKRCIDIDLASLIYTSGSTGKPKGVMMTHLNMVSAAESITAYLESTPDDIIINVLPLSFDYGLYQVIMGFKVGGTVILERSFTYPHTILEKIVIEKVTGFPIVPTLSAILLQMNLKKYDLSRLRYITNTGAALPNQHIFKLREILPHVKIYSMYGLTECKRVSYLSPDQIDVRPDSVGKAMPNEEVCIVDEQGHRVGPGVVGELVVRGANVMKGYWEMSEETERVLKPGPFPGEKVLYTNDLFRMDEEYYLYFVGRKDDIIKSRGEKVSPKEIENVLYGIKEIAEASIVGVPDAVLGEAVKALITLKNGAHLTQQDVLRYCAEHLEDFMVPKFVEFRSTLPRTPTGKIDKKELNVPLRK